MYFEQNNTNRVGSVFIPRKFGVEIEGQRFNRRYLRYQRFESIIDCFMQPTRRESVNRFCLSLQSYDYAVDVDTKERRMRSWKVSLRSFERLGTIEFRHHHATLSTHALQAWLLFLQSFVATSLEVIDEQGDQDLWSPLPEAIALYYLDRLTGRNQE